MSWVFIEVSRVLAVHERQLAEHGGLGGVRDPGALESALARPVNLVGYGDADAAQLAAAYLVGIAKAHAFGDGDKRVAWVTAKLFARKNGYLLRVDAGKALRLVEGAATSSSLEEVASWLRERMTLVESDR